LRKSASDCCRKAVAPSTSPVQTLLPTLASPQLTPSAGSAVSPKRKSVVTLPSLSATSRGLIVAVALVETSRLLAGGGETTGLAVLKDVVSI
jgi:hypothetical protein